MLYEISIERINNKNNPEINREIWANIKNEKTGEFFKKRIWWEDKDGIFHDESYKIPTSLRDLVDNAWYEQSRKW